MSEQRSDVYSKGTDEGVSTAAGEEDATDVVESAGRFRVYLGAAAGVGKTYAMLSEGHRRLKRGTDVVVGYVECHGRPSPRRCVRDSRSSPDRRSSTEAPASRRWTSTPCSPGTPRLPSSTSSPTPTSPAPATPSGGRTSSRCSSAGIDVITTVNIQHLESIADAVEQMTGAQVQERVPDWVVRKADQIELVDSSPEALRRRMLHGNIYPAQKVPQALTHFFRTDNLIALRELALRFLADETEEELLEHLQRHQPSASCGKRASGSSSQLPPPPAPTQ